MVPWGVTYVQKCLLNLYHHHPLWESPFPHPSISVIAAMQLAAATSPFHRLAVAFISYQGLLLTWFSSLPLFPPGFYAISRQTPPPGPGSSGPGPRAGTVLTVPTVPIHCSSDAHKAVKWLVSTFHLFKGSLSKSALTVDDKVAPPGPSLSKQHVAAYRCATATS